MFERESTIHYGSVLTVRCTIFLYSVRRYIKSSPINIIIEPVVMILISLYLFSATAISSRNQVRGKIRPQTMAMGPVFIMIKYDTHCQWCFIYSYLNSAWSGNPISFWWFICSINLLKGHRISYRCRLSQLNYFVQNITLPPELSHCSHWVEVVFNRLINPLFLQPYFK